VDSAEDILSELGPLASLAASLPRTRPLAANHTDLQANSQMPLDKDYKILLDALGFEAASIDQLVDRSGLQVDEVASMLLILELEEHISSVPGGLYLRTPARS
jgi:DNA processing protein